MVLASASDHSGGMGMSRDRKLICLAIALARSLPDSDVLGHLPDAVAGAGSSGSPQVLRKCGAGPGSVFRESVSGQISTGRLFERPRGAYPRHRFRYVI